MKRMAIIVATLLVGSPAYASDSDVNAMRQIYSDNGMELPTEADIAQIERDAAQYPLGSFANPVRAAMPPGQRAYLSRLRCADGNKPSFERSGNLGGGIYGFIVDNYVVDCGVAEPGQVNVVIDMYHEHVETRSVPGFTIVAP